MDRPLQLLATLVLLLGLLAGCAQPSPPADGDPSSPAAPSTQAPPPGPSPATRPAWPFPRSFHLDGCLNPRMLFFVDPAHAQALLPPGYTAADAAELVRYVGIPSTGRVMTGRAVVGYDFLSCPGDSLGGAAAAFSQAGVFVNPPDFGQATPIGPTNLDLYLLAVPSASPAWRALLAAGGFAAGDAPAATIEASQDASNGPLRGGQGSVEAGGALASAAWDGSDSGNALSVHARYWHAAANGTFYLDFRLSETVYAGAIASCSHAAGSVYERLTGIASCAGEPRFAAVGQASQVNGTAVWLPGLFPNP